MRKEFTIIGALILCTSLAQSQTSSGGAAGGTTGSATPSGQSATSSGQAAVSSGQGAASSGQSTAPSGFGTGAQPPPGASVNVGAGVGANQPQDATRSRVFVNTQNRPGMGGTNQPSFGAQPFGGTNQTPFGSTNGQVPFSTNATPSPIAGNGTVNEAAGATATPAPATQTTAADQAFTQRLQAALSQSGATQIYFPQTRSTVQVINQNGTVTLQGIVSSQAEKQSIEARVRGLQGISSIDNQLQVSANPQSQVTTPPTPPAPQNPAAGNGRQLLNP